MIRWRALVPIKQGGGGKSRLAALLSPQQRDGLSLRMALHVVAQLEQCSALAEVAILAARLPKWWQGSWIEDRGQGLNPEIAAWRISCGSDPVLIIHADLPLLEAADVTRLLKVAAAEGIALATDRAGLGSNALAIADGRPFDFRFGPDSRRLHSLQAPAMPVIEAIGLSADLDTPEDLAFVRQQGFVT